MKSICLVFCVLISTVCFGQVKSDDLVGSWSYADITTLGEDSLISKVDNFVLDISEAGSFKITTNDYLIVGSWLLNDSTLTLEGDRSDKQEHRIEKLVIHKLTESTISFSMVLEQGKKAIMNLVRKD